MTPDQLEDLANLRRARDLMDRGYSRPLDVTAMAAAARMSPSHFSRRFRMAYGETPYSYLMTRRIERAALLLRQGSSVTDACMAVGCTSLGSFSARFTEVVGVSPSTYRARDHSGHESMAPCVTKAMTRPRRGPSPVSGPGGDPGAQDSGPSRRPDADRNGGASSRIGEAVPTSPAVR